MPASVETWSVPFFGGIMHGEIQQVERGARTVEVRLSLGMERGQLQALDWVSEYDIVENVMPCLGGTRMILCGVWKGPITREHLEEYRDHLHFQRENAL